MAVALQANPDLQIGWERAVLVTTSPVSLAGFGVATDGERLLVVENESPDEPITKLNLVLDWFEELRRLTH